MRTYDEDFEIEAIEKCTRALNKVDDKSKIRVIRFLLDKFGLINQTSNQSNEVINQTNIQYQQNTLVLTEPKEDPNKPSGNHMLSASYNSIQIKDILIKGLTNSEPEIILMVCYSISNNGKDSFLRQAIMEKIRDQKIYSQSRSKALSSSLASLTKKDFIRSITDEELMITPLGLEAAQNILNGSSTTKKRKHTGKKSKVNKDNSREEFEDMTNESDE